MRLTTPRSSSLQVAGVLAALATVLCAQQPAAPAERRPTPQPSFVDLGTIAVGATVEASVGVLWTDERLGSQTATVDAPPGARVVHVANATNDHQAMAEIQFVLDTQRAGDVDAAITVRCGAETARVPLRARIVAMPPGGSRVLIAETPFQSGSTEDGQQFDAWRKLVASASLDVDYRLVRAGRATFDVDALRRVDVVLAGEGALWALDDGQIALLHGFVCGGGRLVVCANAFFSKTPQIATRLCEPFGVRVLDTEVGAQQALTAGADGIARHPLTAGLAELTVRRASPVELLDPAAGVELVRFAQVNRPYAVLATTQGGGEVVAIGSSLWWLETEQAPGFARLLRNVLVRAPRQR